MPFDSDSCDKLALSMMLIGSDFDYKANAIYFGELNLFNSLPRSSELSGERILQYRLCHRIICNILWLTYQRRRNLPRFPIILCYKERRKTELHDIFPPQE